MVNSKIIATYNKGNLIPIIPFSLDEGREVELIICDDLYDSFSIAGEDVEDKIFAQSEVILEND